MARACERVWRAIERGEKVVIHGDYDADGISGSALLMTAFRAVARALGKDPSLFSCYLPHREKEGYGVRAATVERLAADGAALMITVDCGIGCADEIALAAERGIDVIIVDHHEIPQRVPECIILHPRIEGETYPYKYLAAVGVAFKFACGFAAYCAERGAALGPAFEKWLLDLVAIATVTDVVPLIGENRTLEKFGLMVLNKTRRPGLKKIIEIAGLTPGKLDTVSVGFYIGPRINAASRMEHAVSAFETLMAETEEEAAALAEKLQRLNADRQRYTDEVMAEARARIAASPPKSVCVLAGEGWSAGVVGLVAGKLVSELGLPVFVCGREGDRFVGSGRSIPGFNVIAGLELAAHALARFGGHPQACGLTIDGEENYGEFCRVIREYADETLAGRDLRPAILAECELRMSQVTWPLVQELEKFEPFGEGNPRPRFLLHGLQLMAVERVGKTGAHARICVLGDVPKETKLIAFNMAETASRFAPGSRIDAVVEIGANVWNGNRRIEIKAVDIRQSDTP
jgi:single-stranded-DNA-specific exonuclease